MAWKDDREIKIRFLVEEASHGDEVAFSKLFNIYRPLFYHELSGFRGLKIEKDDILQEMSICLFKAIKNFDITQHRTFGVFLKMCLEHLRCDFFRKQSTLKRGGYFFEPLHLNDEMLGKEVSQKYSTEYLLEVREGYQIAQKSLSISQRATLEKIYSGLSYEQIAKELHLTIGSVKQYSYSGNHKMYLALKHYYEVDRKK